MELLELRHFIAAADLGSFSRAASKLQMTQPALSRQIQKLEQELRTSLFYRHGRGVTLTESGRKLSEVARSVLQQLVDVKQEIVEEGDRPSGRVSFGVPPSIGNTLAASIAQHFREACPDVTLRVQEAFSSILLEWIENGRIDFAVLYNAPRYRNLVMSPLLLEDFFLVQAAETGRQSGSPEVSLAELSELKFLLPGPENGFRRAVDVAARRGGMQLDVIMEIDSIPALKQLVAAGIGSTILPFGAVHQEVGAERLTARPIQSEDMRAMLVAATPLHRPITKATRALLQLVKSEINRCIALGILKGRVVSDTDL